MIFAPGKQQERLRWCFESCKNGAWGAEPDGEHDVVCIRAADFEGITGRLNDGERTVRAVDAPTYAKVALQPGDLVIEKSGGGDKQLVGRAVLFDEVSPSVCSNFLARARPSAKADSAFLNYLLLAIYSGRGTWPHIKQSTGIQNLDLSSYLDTRVSIPLLETQRRIAKFLDDKTARIDALIEKKRALLDRLAEKRQALITHAVTKGVDPTTPMKDSGTDWLGEIPAHWEIKRLKALGQVRYGLAEPPPRDDDGIPFIRATDIFRGIVDLSSVLRVSPEGISQKRNAYLKKGEILVVRSGAYTGDSALVTAAIEGFIAGYDMVFHPQCASPEFLAFVFLSHFMLDAQIYLAKQRAAQPHLNAQDLGNFVLAVPPRAEQTAIADFISSRARAIEVAIDRVRLSMDQLVEYRAALITAAVTGEIGDLR